MSTEVTSAPSQLTDFIVAEVARQSSEAAVRDLVEKKIGEVIKSSVESAFRSYGDIGKQIEKAVTNSLQIGDRLDVPAYGAMVMALLRAKMDETLHDLINQRLSAEMDEILSIAPKELKLTKVVEDMISGLDMADRYGTHVTCIIEEAFPDSSSLKGYLNVFLDEDEDTKQRECKVKLLVTAEGKISSLSIDGYDAKTTIKMSHMWGWQKMIFAAYCSGSTFLVDENDPSTGIGDF